MKSYVSSTRSSTEYPALSSLPPSMTATIGRFCESFNGASIRPERSRPPRGCDEAAAGARSTASNQARPTSGRNRKLLHMQVKGPSRAFLAPLVVTALLQIGCGSATSSDAPEPAKTTAAPAASDVRLARDAQRLLARDYGDESSSPAWYELLQLDDVRAAGGVVTVPTGIGDDADASGPVNAICAVLARSAGELDAREVVVTGDAAGGDTVELGRC